ADAEVYGLEVSSQLQLTCHWKLLAWYSFLMIDSHPDPGVALTAEEQEEGTPANQVFLMSSWNPGCNMEVDFIARYVDSIGALAVPSYITADLRVAWRPSRNLELTVVGQNLFDGSHPEFAGNRFAGEIATEVPRGVYGMMTFRY
ncbi:MAG: TonB-dependent receptor, partial [Pirellulales bacterium]|nr:TonB-dependent receptor [Pirellulales bacterium]